MNDPTISDQENKLENIVEHFSTAMLVTHTDEKKLRARPMQIASKDGSDLWFVTGRSSGKVDEIVASPSCCITLQSSNRFVSLTGKFSVHSDRKLIEEMWQESWKIWFPKGKTDPEITLLRFDSGEGEYWDNAGAVGIGVLFEMGKAYLTGKTPELSQAVHGKVGV